MEKLRIAFIGCGNMSSILQRCVAIIPQYEFVATCDMDEARASLNARRFGALRHYADYQQMLAAEQLDAVFVVGHPELMHYQIGLDVLRRGQHHLFIEKPPAHSVAHALELVAAARQAGRFGMVATMWRHAPAHRMMKSIIDRPEFGQPVMFQGRYVASSPRGPSADGKLSHEWSFFCDQVVHPVDCMRFLMGDVAEVSCLRSTGSNGALAMNATLRFVSGATGTLSLGSCAPSLDQFLMVSGDGGQYGTSVRVHHGTHLEFQRNPNWAETPGGYRDYPAQTWEPGQYYEGHARAGYLEEMRHFAETLLAGEQPRASLEDAWQVMRICQAMLESIESGCRVSCEVNH